MAPEISCILAEPAGCLRTHDVRPPENKSTAIAETIAKRIPMFASYVPPIRKIWNGEDRRMGLFDAAALALAFYKNIADERLGG